MKNTLAVLMTSALCLGATSTPHAEPALTWGVSAGMNRYTEAQMKLAGPELGLHARAANVFKTSNVQLESDILIGKQNYTSEPSGDMSNVGNLETRWRIMGEIAPQLGFSAGLALHTLHNDMRGVSSTGFNGYQRSATQYWLPIRWTPGDQWEYELGILLTGKHKSSLSEASTQYSDINNAQKRGTYLQAGVALGLPNGDTLKPFFRYTHLSASEAVTMGGKDWIEPNNHRVQAGVIWQFASP